MSEQFRTGEGKLFHGLAQKKSVHSESPGQLFEIDEEGMEIGQFSCTLCFDFPLSLWKKACIVEIFWYNSQYVIQLCWLVDTAPNVAAQSLDYLQVNMCVDSTK